MKILNDLDKGYLAALFDGEGCIGAYCDKRSSSFTESVGITNTNMILLEWCKQVTDIGYIVPQGERLSPKHKQGYIWRLRRWEVQQLLPIIGPWLKIKLRQAELVLELLETLKIQKICLGQGRGTHCSDDVKFLRQVICSELADLNRKGPCS